MVLFSVTCNSNGCLGAHSNPLLAHHVNWLGDNLPILALTKSEHLITWYVLQSQELSPSSPGENKTTGFGKELEKLRAKEVFPCVDMTVNILSEKNSNTVCCCLLSF